MKIRIEADTDNHEKTRVFIDGLARDKQVKSVSFSQVAGGTPIFSIELYRLDGNGQKFLDASGKNVEMDKVQYPKIIDGASQAEEYRKED